MPENTVEETTNRIAIILQLDTRTGATPMGPGWYVDAFANTGRYWRTPIAVTPDQAYAIAEVLGPILLQAEGSPDIAPTEIVLGGNDLMRTEITRQLQDYEAELQRMTEIRQVIGMLRERQAQFTIGGGTDLEKPDQIEIQQVRKVNPPRKVTRAKQNGNQG